MRADLAIMHRRSLAKCDLFGGPFYSSPGRCCVSTVRMLGYTIDDHVVCGIGRRYVMNFTIVQCSARLPFT